MTHSHSLSHEIIQAICGLKERHSDDEYRKAILGAFCSAGVIGDEQPHPGGTEYLKTSSPDATDFAVTLITCAPMPELIQFISPSLRRMFLPENLWE